jgi:carbamoyl-phosphate synthase large subunit
VVNKVAEGRPHIVDMIKNDEIALIVNTVEEKRQAIADSRSIRTSALQQRVTLLHDHRGCARRVRRHAPPGGN